MFRVHHLSGHVLWCAPKAPGSFPANPPTAPEMADLGFGVWVMSGSNKG